MWKPSNNLVAQLAHVFAGMGVPLLLYTLLGHPLAWIAGMVGYAAIKEFVFDKYVEDQSFADNLKDFTVYSIGIGVATLAIWR